MSYRNNDGEASLLIRHSLRSMKRKLHYQKWVKKSTEFESEIDIL
jgi:hypothetical protein